MREYYVYIHKSKETGEVFYVGKGTGGRAFGDWHQRLYKKEDVDIEIVEYFDDKMLAFKFEEILTKTYHNLGEAKYNKSVGARITPETKQLFSEKYKGENNPNFQNYWEEEQKQNISGNKNGMFNQPSPTRRKCKLIESNGKVSTFNFVGEAYKYFKENFGLSMGKVKELLATGNPYTTHYGKYKHLEGMRMEYIEESSPRIIIISATDRAGKDTLIAEIDKQTKYKHITIDRGPDAFQAYCGIFNKSDDLKDQYKKMEKNLAMIPDVLAIYIDCSTEELIRRCKETDHEILDFDFHKAHLEFHFDSSSYMHKIKIDTTHKHVKEIVKDLIEKGIL